MTDSANTKKTYPECEKWAKVQEQARIVEDFLGFLQERDIVLCTMDGHDYFPWRGMTGGAHKKHLMEFFEIDEKKLEAERQEMLSNLWIQNNS